jgi:hypothetical protein
MAAEPMETKPTIVCLLERAIEKASKRKWRRPRPASHNQEAHEDP